MLVVRGELERRQAIINIGIQRFIPAAGAVSAEQGHLAVPIHSYRALVDTGAQRTCLAHHVIDAQHLIRHGNRFIRNVHNENMHSLFWANVGIWSNGTTDDMEERNGYFALSDPTEVINIADNDNFDAILGMDVLRFFDVRFDRTGAFEIKMA